ncbi:MAG: 1-(5-phosphoribosyl)-5-amino-4-imidazole-carboxylate carboxylase [Armatimonadetes bacterium JP3_11]|nr:MAG: 1-(5-phosphoribosyl)-5-amino-4-imidazole-carboxylate carboxylase [Armatimonadetes bacterium CP1_7O]OYT76022.1 MAG: 1-(5-phosphoribosyl)-5-amino-4-imidazole-carboxylate carboxylase [Armatimonadetes bacterium JP3_11]RMH10270.1 MAG: nickel pincer cofactor biosynthesis protein LarB [Armatimonadota bacterium]
MEVDRLRALLNEVAHGTVSVEEALARLRDLPFQNLQFARIDHHRALRKGFPEVVFCQGKTPEQVAEIVARLAERGRVLATRASEVHAHAVQARLPDAVYHPLARAITLGEPPPAPESPYGVVCAAGTADIPVAEEAVLTARMMGARVETLYDVGVAGIHRLLEHLPLLQGARGVVVVAGMEGALPSVVGGLVPCPVIAVPTSVGYGAHFGGLAPLLTMLNACAPGVVVVNIDNGFGAGYCLGLILRAAQ